MPWRASRAAALACSAALLDRQTPIIVTTKPMIETATPAMLATAAQKIRRPPPIILVRSERRLKTETGTGNRPHLGFPARFPRCESVRYTPPAHDAMVAGPTAIWRLPLCRTRWQRPGFQDLDFTSTRTTGRGPTKQVRTARSAFTYLERRFYREALKRPWRFRACREPAWSRLTSSGREAISAISAWSTKLLSARCCSAAFSTRLANDRLSALAARTKVW